MRLPSRRPRIISPPLGGTSSSSHFEICGPNRAKDQIIAWNQVILDVKLDLIGLVRNFKCLDHNPCVPAGIVFPFDKVTSRIVITLSSNCAFITQRMPGQVGYPRPPAQGA